MGIQKLGPKPKLIRRDKRDSITILKNNNSRKYNCYKYMCNQFYKKVLIYIKYQIVL